MDVRKAYRDNSKKTTNTRLTNTGQQNTASNTISTKRHFKVLARSNDKAASNQNNSSSTTSKNVKPQPEPSPDNLVTNELSCKSANTTVDLEQTTNTKNYSSRNMLRNSRPVTSNEIAGPSMPHYLSQESLPWQNKDDLRCYTKLTTDCFLYDDQNGSLSCLLCGRKGAGKSWRIDEHLQSEYHINQFRQLDLRLLEENLDESSLQICTIKALCDKWYTTYSMTDSLIGMRNYAVIQLEEILGSINPECQLRIHGSSHYGAATKDSDVNIELLHPNSKLFQFDPRSKKSLHHRLIDPDAEYGNQFNEHTMHYDLASNPVEILFRIFRIVSDSSQSLPSYPFTVASSLGELNSKIPSITLVHRVSGSTLNVTCYSERRFNLAHLLRIYINLDPRLEQLSLLVKVWARFCQIDNPDLGSLPPHAYVIMMIYFLQRTEPPVLPCLHELAAQNAKPDQTADDPDLDSINTDLTQKVESNKLNGAPDDDLEDEDEDNCLANIEEYVQKDFNWKSDNKTPVHVLFIQFFKTMIDEFSAVSNVMTIRTLKLVPSRCNSQSKDIEHPIDRGINISRCIASMKTFEFIKDSFIHSYYYLTSIPIDENMRPRRIIKSDPRDYINLYVNAHRLDSYRAMKEQSTNAKYDPINQMVQQKLFARDVEILHALSISNQGASLPQTLANLYDTSFLRPQNITYSYSCQLCRSTGHSKERCPKGIIDNLRNEYISYDSALDETADLDSSFITLYKKEAISAQLAAQHNRILNTLRRIVNEALELGLSFVLYGSTVNNLGSCDSDLDICVTVKENPTGKDVDCVAILKSILDVLQVIPDVHAIQPVFSAKVPIIRFKYEQFDIDLSMYNQCAIYNSKLLRAYTQINPMVAPLCYLVKKFAKVSFKTPRHYPMI